jgi:Transposase DDE domain group 1
VAYPMGEATAQPLRVDFDRRIKLEFHGARITSDGGLLAYRELDDAFGLTDVAINQLLDGRRGKNARHTLGGLFRQSVFGRLAGYEDVNDAERLARDPAMRAIVGREGLDRAAASSSQMGRFETEWLATDANLAALTDLSGTWIGRIHDRKPPRTIVLDMDSSESPTHGEQEGSAWNGHFGCTCYHPLFLFNQFGDLERCILRPGNAHSAEDWRLVLEPVIARYQRSGHRALLPRRCGVRQARDLRAAGGRRHPLRDPPAGQPGVAAADWAPADPTGRPAAQEAGHLVRQLPLPGQGLDPTPSRGGEDRVASGRALSPCRLHRDQPDPTQPAGGQVLQRSRNGGAMDPRGQERAPLDAPVLSRLPPQRRAASAARSRLQPRQLHAHAGPAPRRSSIGR